MQAMRKEFEMLPHSAANLFPMMDDEAFAQLKADIAEHGQREPIIVHNGLVLDGRNRLKACQELGIEPDHKQFEGSEGEVLDFVISLNLHRRHLSTTQRAVVAADIANMKQGERTDLEPSVNLQKVSTTKAAEMLNVSTSAVNKVKKIQREGEPEILDAMKKGDMTVNEASNVIKLPSAEQRELAQKPKEERRELSLGDFDKDKKLSTASFSRCDKLRNIMIDLADFSRTPTELMEEMPAFMAADINENFERAFNFLDAFRAAHSKWEKRNVYRS